MMAASLLPLTEDAQSELDRYLRRVKGALRAYPSVDAEEVEHDIRRHIDAELGKAPAPITQARLRSVLERLGSPGQWVPAEELPLWRRVLLRLRSGPEDWRLAYLTLAFFVAGPIAGEIGPVFFFASIGLARATLALLDEEGEPVGARRWLVYPPLLAIYLAILTAAAALPLALAASAADQIARDGAREWLPEPFWLSLALVSGFAAGLWWTMLGLLVGRFSGAVRGLFWPFAEWFERRHGMRIALVGLVVLAAAATGFAAMVWS